jgi:hypothetical protein
MWLGPLVFVLGYFVYLECHPGYGAIWCRQDDQKQQRIAWGTMKMLVCEPFLKKMWWQPFYWDMNFWLWIVSGLLWDSVILQCFM